MASDVEGGLEIADEDAHVRVAALGIALDAFEDGSLEGRGDIGVEFAGGHKVQGAVKLFAQDFLGRVAGERFAAGEQFVGGDAVGEDIDAVIDRFVADLFGSHVSGSAGVSGHALGLRGSGEGEIKIDEPEAAIAREEHVLGFEIEVHETAFVDMLEGQSHIDEDIADGFGEERVIAGAEQLEVGALDILHEEKEVAVDFAVREVTDDVFVGMDAGEDITAAEETAFGDEVDAEVMVEAAEGEGLALGIGGEPDIGHATTVDELLQIVGAELSGFGQFSLRNFRSPEERHDNQYLR
jgi:hypothetical protein